MSPWLQVTANGTCVSVTLGYLHSPKWWPRFMASVCSWMVSEFTDITTDPGCSRAMTQTWPLTAALAWSAPLPQVSVLVIEISMALAVAQPLETNKVSGCGLELENCMAFSSNMGHRTSTLPYLW